MYKIIKIIFLFIALVCTNVSAAILDKDEADKADLNLLEDETVLFQSIGMGIALSIAQCEGVDLCSLTVEESEVEILINTLDQRIDSLILKQEEAEDPVGFDKVLTAYISERENYAIHLEKLKSIASTLNIGSELLDEPIESEAEDFPVDSVRNEELLDYLNELEAFEDDELEDDEDVDSLEEILN